RPRRPHQHPRCDPADLGQVAHAAVRVPRRHRDPRVRTERPDHRARRGGRRDLEALAPAAGGRRSGGVRGPFATIEPYARRGWPPLFLCGVVVLTWILIDNFADVVYTDTAVKMFLMLIVVLGLQTFSGNSGVLSFGHVAFMAVGAYTSALL